MKLWLLRPSDDGAVAWKTWHNCMFGFVVRAQDERAARMEAARLAGDEGPGTWLERPSSSCVELTAGGPAGVIISDHNRAE